MMGLRERYEEHHGVRISEEAIKRAVALSDRYIQDRFFPDKAIDVLDEACAKASVTGCISNSEFVKFEEKIRQIEEEKTNAVKNQDYSLALKLREEEMKCKSELERMSGFFVEEKKRYETVEPEDIEEIINEMTGIPLSGITRSLDGEVLKQKLKDRIYGQDEAINSLVMAVMRNESGINNPERPKGVFYLSVLAVLEKQSWQKLFRKSCFLTKNL